MFKQPCIIPGTYLYFEKRDKLTYIQYVDIQEYFDGDDWTREEIPHIVEITDRKEKQRILKRYPYLLE